MEVLTTMPKAATWAGLPAQTVIGELATSMHGLARDEVALRAARYGPNILPRPRRHPWYLELGANFLHLFALLLWTGAVLAWLAGMPQLAEAIVAVVLVNGLFSYWQEYRAERAVEELQSMLPRQVIVRRDGQEQLVSAAEIVSGDLLILTEGETIQADARVVTSAGLRVDLSSLTGESRPDPALLRSRIALTAQPLRCPIWYWLEVLWQVDAERQWCSPSAQRLSLAALLNWLAFRQNVRVRCSGS